jgi:uncharacterized membrane protein
MSKYDWLLFLHLLGAGMLVAGALAYHVIGFAIGRRDRPSEIATLVRLGRPLNVAIPLGAVMALGFGIWLAYTGREIPQYKITDEWIIASILLWVIGMALGSQGGRIYAEGGKLAERLAAHGDAPSPELRAIMQSPRAAVMTWASTAALLTILVLMVWKPGAP